MSEYYSPQRTRGLYDPLSSSPFKLSRSKIDLFLECPRCFYLDRRLGVGRPPGFPFALNAAVDKLLKKEFDILRAKNKAHPLMKKYGIDAVPVAHKDLDAWRHNFTGVQYLHQPTNFLVFGAIDDLWARLRPAKRDYAGQARQLGNSPRAPSLPRRQAGWKEGDKPTATDIEYIVVDYKATAKEEEITALDKDWQDGYKRQMEIYQWLLRQNGYQVSDTGYFVYCNGKTDCEAFDAKLEFDITLIPYAGNDGWVEKALLDAHQCLNSDAMPKAAPDCDYCNYIEAVNSKG